MKITFEHNYQQKFMRQSFTEMTRLEKKSDILMWRQQWTDALKSWHSPYKLLIDCRNLTIGEDPEVKASLDLMLRFFSGLFLRKAVGFGFDSSKRHNLLPFEVEVTEEASMEKLGLRQAVQREATDFRSLIQLENHFQQHTIELSFIDEARIESMAEVATLKSKMMNNLMQWHSKWNLLVDCSKLEVNAELKPEFDKLFSFFNRLFLKRVVGYSPKSGQEYPFLVFRARHRAVAEMENEGAFSGADAQCRSKQTPVKSKASAE